MPRAGVLHKHAVLTMHRHEEARLGEGQHQLLIFLEAVTRHVNTLTFAINDLGPEHHQPVDRVDHGDGVARNGTGGKDNRVAGFHFDLRMLSA